MDNYKITRNVYTIPTDRPREAPPAKRPPEPKAEPIVYSVIVPFYNEAGIVEKLCLRISRVMRRLGKVYEIILVNDGSTDETGRILEQIAWRDDRVTVLELRRNFGQTTAIQAGFDASVGSIIIAMDGDLQHDPYEIPLFIRKIDEGYDIASGWRVRRGDNLFGRRIPSKVANWMLSMASGVKLHDFGTTFKAYRREVLEGVRLYGDMHRFVPAVCARLGAKICEVPIKNVRRASGKSNYGLQRTFRVALDLLTLRFMTAYLTRPLHFFGKWGMMTAGTGLSILAYGFIRKLVNWKFSLFAEHGPLMAAGFMLVVVSMLLFSTGLMGDLLMRIYFEAAGNKTYAVRRVIRREPPSALESDER